MIHNLSALCYAEVMHAERDVAISLVNSSLTFVSKLHWNSKSVPAGNYSEHNLDYSNAFFSILKNLLFVSL